LKFRENGAAVHPSWHRHQGVGPCLALGQSTGSGQPGRFGSPPPVGAPGKPKKGYFLTRARAIGGGTAAPCFQGLRLSGLSL